MVRNKRYINTLRQNQFDLDESNSFPPVKRLLGGMTAAALALSIVLATVVPVRAETGNDDLLKALAAFAAIALLANGMSHADEPESEPEPVNGPKKPKKHPKVPTACSIEIDSPKQPIRVFSERCMREEGFNYSLPHGCSRDIRIFGRADLIYGAKCLEQAGFNVGHGAF